VKKYLVTLANEDEYKVTLETSLTKLVGGLGTSLPWLMPAANSVLGPADNEAASSKVKNNLLAALKARKCYAEFMLFTKQWSNPLPAARKLALTS
jgi:hypothetical protein